MFVPVPYAVVVTGTTNALTPVIFCSIVSKGIKQRTYSLPKLSANGTIGIREFCTLEAPPTSSGAEGQAILFPLAFFVPKDGVHVGVTGKTQASLSCSLLPLMHAL